LVFARFVHTKRWLTKRGVWAIGCENPGGIGGNRWAVALFVFCRYASSLKALARFTPGIGQAVSVGHWRCGCGCRSRSIPPALPCPLRLDILVKALKA